MAEIQLQLSQQKTLKALSEATEAVKASDMATITGATELNIGKHFKKFNKLGLAQLVDKKEKTWQITEEGRQIADNIQLPEVPPAEPPAVTSTVRPTVAPKVPPEEITETIPSQADLFRGIGEKLGVGAKKGEVRLDAIIYYVQRTALCFLYSLVQGVQLKSSAVQLSLDFIESSNLGFHIVKKWFSPKA